MAGKDAYDLDGVANVESTDWEPLNQFPTRKGDTGLDNVISVDTDASMTNDPDETFPTGKKVEINAVTDLPMGEGATLDYAGSTGHVKQWPRAWGK